jgi:hypothetical protein
MREFAPRVQAQLEAAKQRREEEVAQVKLPANVLASAYAAYIDVKKCQVAREGYADVYVSDPEMDQAKAAVRQIEGAVRPKLGSNSSTDVIWSQVMQTEGQSFEPNHDFQPGTRYLCQNKLASLQQTLREQVPESGKIKKDL